MPSFEVSWPKQDTLLPMPFSESSLGANGFILTLKVVCPYFGNPALTSSFTKYTFLKMKNSFATIVNGLSVKILFQLSNDDLSFS